MLRSVVRTLILAMLSTPALSAQQVIGSTITGHVFCADTNAPARFAKVMLKSAGQDHAFDDWMNRLHQAEIKNGRPPGPMSEEERKSRSEEFRMDSMDTDMRNSATVSLDGSFTFTGVKPGTYYVHAIFAGYIDPFAQLSDADFTSSDPAIRVLVALVPTISVSGTDSARIDLRLERGAAASGRLLFEDGSPAAGWTISALRPNVQAEQFSSEYNFLSQILFAGYGVPVVHTDDRGQFRISGLPAGDYILRGTLLAGVSMEDGAENARTHTVYTGDTFSRAKAKTIHVSSAEENTTADINIPFRTLHSIGGHVEAKSEDHTINEGQVRLSAPDDSSVHSTAHVQPDGSFRFDYLPVAAYTLTIADAAESRRASAQPARSNNNDMNPIPSVFVQKEDPRTEVVHHFGPASLSVTLGDTDIDSVHIIVPDLTDASRK